MPVEELPPPIRAFIARHIRSVEHLEILLLFTPGATWTVQSAYDKIMSAPQSVERALDEFVRQGLLERTPDLPPAYRSAADEPVHEILATLGQFYRVKPVRVIEAIYRRDKGAAQSFADAFKINPDPDS